MIEKLRTFLSEAAYGVYVLLFGFIFYRAMFNNTAFQYDVNLQLKIIAAVLLYITVVMVMYSRFSGFFLRHRYKLLFLAVAMVFTVQYTIGNNVVHAAIYDHERVLNGAMMWASGITGEEFIPYGNYIHYYTNNLGLFMVQQQLFKFAASMGFTNLYTVAIFTGHLLFAVMITASFMYLDENISGHRALFFLLIICLYLPLYFQSSISYTDTYSVWGIPCLLLFISRGIRAKTWGKKIFYAILSGGIMALATQIKTTVAIVVIALFIQAMVNNFKIRNIAFFAVLLVTFTAAYTAFDRWTYDTVRDRNRDIEAMPLTHWLMMGLQGDGSYNGADEHRITLGVPPEKRVEKNIEVIKDRLEEMGLEGYRQLLYRKTCRTFGSGNAEVYYTFKYDMEYTTPFNFVYECTLEDGRYYPNLNNAAQAVYMTAVLLGTIGGLAIMLRRRCLENFAPHVALVGFWMFMMLWESNHRQLINQWSLFFIVAAIGLYNIWRIFFEKDKTVETVKETEAVS